MSHTSRVSRAAQRATNGVHEGAESAKQTIVGAASDLLETAKDVGVQAKEAVQEGLSGIRDTATDYVKQGRKKMQNMEHVVEERIQSRPFMALLMAIGFGFIVGWLFRRSK
jgi:ElaB/YqjD/DUF883 family membrane-anchored ribosome-binding protein